MRVSREPFFAIFLLTACLFAQSGVPPKPKAARPSVILITLDTTRADRMGFLGSDRGLTPHLDAVAREGIVFTRAYAHVPLTTPSHASLLSGTLPQFNHVVDLGDPIAKDVPYLPDILHHHGYATAVFVGGAVLDPQAAAPGFDRGIDHYDAGFHEPAAGESRYSSIERRGDVVIDHATTWLAKHPRRPVFLWVHLYDPHDPYDPPEPYKSKYAANLYDGEIAYADAAAGRLLDSLRKNGLYDGSLIAIVADHGEAFGEHGEREHGIFVYDETIHVPLLLRLPGQRHAGSRVDQRVGLSDVAPTILAALDIAAPASMQGASLLPSLGHPPSDRSIYSESEYGRVAYGWATLRSWRSGKYLFVAAPRRELYDQVADPGALRNLAPDSAAVADTLSSQLDEFHEKTSSAATEKPELAPQAGENLRALGYVSSPRVVKEDKSKPALDPKDHIEVANLMHEGLIDIQDQRFSDAISKLRKAAELAPETGMVQMEFGNALLQNKQSAEAILALRKAVELMPDAGPAHNLLGVALMDRKDWAGAIAELQAALDHSKAGGSADLHLDLGIALSRNSRIFDAASQLETAAQMDPGSFRANLEAGRILGMQGNPNGALPYLQQAVLLDPNSQDAHHFLANVYRKLGRDDEAAREQDEADRLKSEK